MIRYLNEGLIPKKKHTSFFKEDGQSLYWEELFSTGGFEKNYSTKYHYYLPTSVQAIDRLEDLLIKPCESLPLQAVHFKTDAKGSGVDFIDNRQVMLMSERMRYSIVVHKKNNEFFFKNGSHHELYFVHEGTGVLASEYGELTFRPGDYLLVPKGTIYQLRTLECEYAKMLLVESQDAYEIPKEFRSDMGQILEHAPYSERDFRVPQFKEAIDEKGRFDLIIHNQEQRLRYGLDHHPFDVVGWDGYVYPIAFNIEDYCPIVGKLHMPPSVHKVFDNKYLMVTNFVPRMMDFHPRAIPVPYYHFNCDCDEVLYYMKGNFMSRKGIAEGSVTWHPMGIPHGPQPGKVESSLGMKEVDEWAVMVDVFAPLRLTEKAKAQCDRDYFKSWSK